MTWIIYKDAIQRSAYTAVRKALDRQPAVVSFREAYADRLVTLL